MSEKVVRSWEVNEFGEVRQISDCGNGEVYRSSVFAKLKGRTKHSKKKAALISAAPDLLAALKQATFLLETIAHLRGMERDLMPAVDVALAAIAKAGDEA